jgi:hypothetical protein
MSDELKVVIIAGPNGAGKTTFAREFLPNEAHCPTFINADLIAAGLSPFQPETVAVRAGRLMLEEIEERVRHRQSFAFETTLSGRTYAKKIHEWQTLGYHVKLRRKTMSGKKIVPKDADLANVEKALKRAAKTARSLAEKTQTPCYVVKDGKIINVTERETAYRPARRKTSEK